MHMEYFDGFMDLPAHGEYIEPNPIFKVVSCDYWSACNLFASGK